jgi:hypothetical protein
MKRAGEACTAEGRPAGLTGTRLCDAGTGKSVAVFDEAGHFFMYTSKPAAPDNRATHATTIPAMAPVDKLLAAEASGCTAFVGTRWFGSSTAADIATRGSSAETCVMGRSASDVRTLLSILSRNRTAASPGKVTRAMMLPANTDTETSASLMPAAAATWALIADVRSSAVASDRVPSRVKKSVAIPANGRCLRICYTTLDSVTSTCAGAQTRTSTPCAHRHAKDLPTVHMIQDGPMHEIVTWIHHPSSVIPCTPI